MSARPTADDEQSPTSATAPPHESLRSFDDVVRRLESSPTTSSASWSRILLSSKVAEVALGAVGYNKNYDRGVTSRLCLHYVNTVRTRVLTNITYYLLSVDGCESSKVTSGGRCDDSSFTDRTPYTYELRLRQKAVNSSVFMVESIFKELEQKEQGEIADESSNLDFTAFDTYESGDSTPNVTSAPPATSSGTPRAQTMELEMHSQPSFSFSNDILPQRFRSFMSAGSPTVMALASIGFVFGIAVALVVVRIRANQARALKQRRKEFRRRPITCYTPLQPESS
jgi:hypothetical protein